MSSTAIPSSRHVGPNAVLQLRTALSHRGGLALSRRVFGAAKLDDLLRTPPEEMIEEDIPSALFSSLYSCLPTHEAAATAREAGQRTADYIIAHRIPAFARLLLKMLPVALARPALLKAIEKNAWTFAGSGRCRALYGRPAIIEIERNPISQPGCVWHVAVFERLFRKLVDPRTRVVHTDCVDAGAAACRFEIRTS